MMLPLLLTGFVACDFMAEDTVSSTEITLPVPSFTLLPNVPNTSDDVSVQLSPVNGLTSTAEPVWHFRWTTEGKQIETPILTHLQTRSGELWNIEIWYTLGSQESVHIDYDFQIQDSSAGVELSILPLQPRSDQDVVGFTNVLDPDYHVLDIQYKWARNGFPLDWDENVIPESMTQKGDQWTMTLQSLNGLAVTQSPIYQFSIGNTAPLLSGGTLYPAEPNQVDSLQANLDVFDHDDDVLVPEYRWFVNDSRLDGVDGTHLSLEPFERGDSVFAEIRVFDGDDYSQWVNTQPVIIQNTPPTIQEIVLSNENPSSKELVSCDYNGFEDLDLDSDNSIVAWVRNGNQVASGQFLNLGSVYAQPYQTYFCIVRAYDGFDFGTVLFKRFQVRNTPPVVYDVSLTPDPAYVNEPLSCTPNNVQDIDGSIHFDFEYEWYVNGNQLDFDAFSSEPPAVIYRTYQVDNPDTTSEQESIDAFKKGDTVVCSVAADDRTGHQSLSVGPTTYSNGIQIQNSVPTATGVILDPPNPNREDIVTCSVEGYLDVDRDEDQSIIHWYQNGEYIYTGDSINLFLLDAQLTDVFTCEVQLFDGEDFGATYVVTTQATNQPPEVLSVELTPELPSSQDSIQATVVYDDADGDLVTLSYFWYVNNLLQTENSNQLAGPFSPGDQIRLEVEPSDGIVVGNRGTSLDVEVQNTPPSDPEVILFEDSNGLYCQANESFFDLDGDVVSVDINWYCDTAELSTTTSGQTLQSQLLTTAYLDDTVPTAVVSECILWQCSMQTSDGQSVSNTVLSNLFIP